MISVRQLLAAERDAVVALRVAPGQETFVASNARSLQQADQQDFCTPLGIHADGELVGFAMYALDPDDGNYWVYRLMIDQRFQGRGYGAAALSAVLEQVSALPGCSTILLGVMPANEVAARLYRRLGFVETGDIVDGEIVMAHGRPAA